MEFSIKMLNIGSLDSFDNTSEKSALLTQTGLSLQAFHQGGSIPINIPLKDVVTSHVSFQTFQPFLNLSLKNSLAGKIRDKLGLEFSDFDTKSKRKNLKQFCISFNLEPANEKVEEYDESTKLLKHVMKVLPKVKVLDLADVGSYLQNNDLFTLFNKHCTAKKVFPLQIPVSLNHTTKYKILVFTEKQKRQVRKICSYISDGTNVF